MPRPRETRTWRALPPKEPLLRHQGGYHSPEEALAALGLDSDGVEEQVGMKGEEAVNELMQVAPALPAEDLDAGSSSLAEAFAKLKPLPMEEDFQEVVPFVPEYSHLLVPNRAVLPEMEGQEKRTRLELDQDRRQLRADERGPSRPDDLFVKMRCVSCNEFMWSRDPVMENSCEECAINIPRMLDEERRLLESQRGRSMGQGVIRPW